MANRFVLLTGATGIMGSWALAEALRRGYEPVVLMRDATENEARKRLRRLLELNGCARLLPRVCIAQGDTQKADLGLPSAMARKLTRTLDAVVHCAACTSFNERNDQTIWSTNLQGTRRVVEFLQGTGIPLYHVSTAYVAGKRSGRVLEFERDVNQSFNNTYEQSKCASEGLVDAAFQDNRLHGAIFRPSIIVGASSDGRISQFANLYQFLRAVDMLESRTMRGERIEIVGNPVATKNAVAVDWAVNAMWRIIEREGASGRVYHLTNPEPLRLGELAAWANDRLHKNGSEVVLVKELSETKKGMESALAKAFQHYQGYLMHEPQFDRANTECALAGELPCPPITLNTLTTLSAYARSQKWHSLLAETAPARPKPPVTLETETRRRVAGYGAQRLAYDVPIPN